MSRLEPSFKEKRNFIRMKVDTPIVIKNSDGLEIAGGRCLDLSGGGMLISTPSAVPIGCELEVSLSSPYGHNPMLRAHTRVNRVVTDMAKVPNTDAEDSLHDQSCRVGLEILAMID